MTGVQTCALPIPVLRSLTFPILEFEKGKIQFPLEGSRDALCSLIGKAVKEIYEKDEVAIRLTFESGEVLTIPLDRESTRASAGEGAHFVPEGHGRVLVW